MVRIFVLTLLLIFLEHNVKSQEVIIDSIPGSDVSFSLLFVKGNDSITDLYFGTHEVTYDMFVLFKRKEFDKPVSDLKDDYTPDAITRPTPPYEDMTWGMGTEGGFPAVSMTQEGAFRFCEWLYLKTGRFYRLPTNAEWTYAASTLKNKDGWFAENSGDAYHKTGSFSEDEGIFDMFGNVMEWTLDKRVLKGGSYIDDAQNINAATIIKYDRKWKQRDPQIPKSIWWLTDGPFVGFRLVSPLVQPTKEEIEAFFATGIE